MAKHSLSNSNLTANTKDPATQSSKAGETQVSEGVTEFVIQTMEGIFKEAGKDLIGLCVLAPRLPNNQRGKLQSVMTSHPSDLLRFAEYLGFALCDGEGERTVKAIIGAFMSGANQGEKK